MREYERLKPEREIWRVIKKEREEGNEEEDQGRYKSDEDKVE